ncbi:septum formation initiator family protein [Paracoccus sp. p4-l81]|uniref:FtsB family cell division protein n=1 Tax=unclassified Paracoccus (in: a-proteobacteria) TaxID=2688777 RepID=UPI0035B7A047
MRAYSPRRLTLFPLIYGGALALMAILFAYAAVQGQFGILRRVQVEAETQTLIEERQALQDEVARMENLTRRLSDDFLDLDLLDERARDILGLMRADDLVVR